MCCLTGEGRGGGLYDEDESTEEEEEEEGEEGGRRAGGGLMEVHSTSCWRVVYIVVTALHGCCNYHRVRYIAMVFVFSPYILKYSSDCPYFQFQVSLNLQHNTCQN